LDELTVDVQLTQNLEEGHCNALLAIATEKKVSALVSQLALLGIEPDKIEVSTVALRRALGQPEDGTSVACHVAPHRLDVDIAGGAEIRFSRGLETAHLNGNIDALASEIERSLAYAMRDAKIGKIDRVEIVGDAAVTASLTRILPPEYTSGPAYGFYSRWTGHEPDELCGYAAAIGAGLSEDEGFNLLPSSLRGRQHMRSRIRSAVSTILLLFTLVGLASATTGRYIKSAEAYLAQNREALIELEPKVAELRDFEGQEKAIASHLDKSIDALEIYTELFRAIPQSLTIYRFEYDAGRRRVTIAGQAPDFANVNTLLESMSKSRLFTDVVHSGATRQKSRSGRIINFRIEATIGGKS